MWQNQSTLSAMYGPQLRSFLLCGLSIPSRVIILSLGLASHLAIKTRHLRVHEDNVSGIS